MESVVQVGPLSLNAPVLFFALSLVFWFFILRLVAKKIGADYKWIRSVSDGAVLVALISARLVFAVQYWQAYLSEPWTVLYFWQSGYSFWGGLTGAAVYAGYRVIRTRPSQPVLQATLWASISILTLGCTFIGLAIIQPSSTSSNTSLAPVRQVPFEFTDAQGNTVSFVDYINKPIVLNFWATWCAPCRREMPLLENNYKKYTEQGVAIIAVNVGEQADVVRQYLDKNSLTLPIWMSGKHSTNQLFDYVNGQVMPTTLFIHADGRIESRRVGELSAATLQQGIEAIR